MPQANEAKAILITATDTGVGKTFVTCAIARHLAARGIDVGVMKPVATGCVREAEGLRCGDAELLIAASGVSDSSELVTPVSFEPSLAPTAASRATGRILDRARIREAFVELTRRHQVLLVEGIGGLLVPLEGKFTVRDLARELALPLLVVARDGLGTINHTALTCEAARRAGLEVRGIVLNRLPSTEADLSTETNAQEIEALTGIRVVVRFGPCSGYKQAARALDAGVIDKLLGL